MNLLKLDNDVMYKIYSNLNINNTINFQLCNKHTFKSINIYSYYTYNNSFYKVKVEYYIYRLYINNLMLLFNLNKEVFKNIDYYNISGVKKQDLYKEFTIKSEFQNYIYSDKKFYEIIVYNYILLYNIIHKSHLTYYIFFKYCNYNRINNTYYLNVNLNNTYKNFIQFLILFNYLKQFIRRFIII